MGQAEWIWYPGDFEIMLANKTMIKRFEQDVMIPPFWRSDAFYCNVKFKRSFTLTKKNIITIKACGALNIIVNNQGEYREKYVKKFNGQLILDPGSYDLQVTVYNHVDLPCLYITSEELNSDKSFLATCNDGIWKEAAVGNFTSILSSPNDFSLPEKKIGGYKKTIISDTETLFEFERAVVCRLNFFEVKQEGYINIIYGESKEEALDIQNAEQTDYLYLKEKTKTPIAKIFKYILIKSEGAVFSDPEFWFEESGIDQKSRFDSSDKVLNAIYDTSAYTFYLNSREFFLDGVKRDRWIWSGDAAQSYLMDFYSFFNLDCVRRTIIALGGKSPVTSFINHIMDYTLYWIISFKEYFDNTGDSEFIRKNFAKIKEHLEFVGTRLNNNGFLEGKESDWVFVDWANLDNSGVVCVEQILYYKALSVAGFFADYFKEKNDYIIRAEVLKANINQTFWSDDLGCYVYSLKNGKKDNIVTRHANLFAVLYDICNEQQKESILKNVLMNQAIQSILTPYMRFYELETLCKLGKHVFVLTQIKKYWGGMLNEGATTFWEQFDEREKGLKKYEMYGRPYGKSLCHAWGASPLYLIGRYFIGLRPGSAGKSYVLEPNRADLKWFKAVLPLYNGEIKIYFSESRIEVFCAEKDGELVLPEVYEKYVSCFRKENGKIYIPIKANTELIINIERNQHERNIYTYA